MNRVARAALVGLGLALLVWTLREVGAGLASLVGPREAGGVDLWARWEEARLLWSRESPYITDPDRSWGAYPPASLVLLGVVAWIPEVALPWAWVVSATAVLLGLGVAAWRLAGAPGSAGLLLLAGPASVAGVAYGLQNGQLHVHVAGLLVATVLLLGRGNTWAAALAFLFALVKPTMAAPLFYLFLARRERWGAAAGIVAAYLVLTAVGVALVGQEGLLEIWFSRARQGASFGSGGSYGNVHAWSVMLGLDRFDVLWTLLALGAGLLYAVGGSADGERGPRLWAAAGLLALLARVATYHQDYDDTLLIPVGLALLAVGSGGRRAAFWAAGALVLVHLPGREHLWLGAPHPSPLEVARVLVWGWAAWLLVRGARAAPGPDQSG